MCSSEKTDVDTYQNLSSKTLCRLCANEIHLNKLLDVKKDVGKCREINIKLTRLNSLIDFNDNELPSTVCYECCTALQDAYDFVISVDRAKLLFNNRKLISSKDKCLRENDIKIEIDEVSNPQDLFTAQKLLTVANSGCSVTEDICSPYKPEDSDHILELSSSNNVKLECSTILKTCDAECSDTIKSFDTETKLLLRRQSGIMRKSPSIINSSKPKNICVNEPVPLPLYSKTKEEKKSKLLEINKVGSHKKKVKDTWKDYHWACSICETQFPTCGELTDHSMHQHHRCNAFSCLDCKRKSSTLNCHIRHIKKKHRDDLKWSCYKCFEPFHSQLDKTKHIAVHLSTELTCPGCNTCFETLQELNVHKNIFYKPRPSVSKQLQEFEGKFSGLTCLMCNKAFTNIHVLLKHLIRVHTEPAKPCVCEICGKRYVSNSELSDHIVSHSELRPFKCEICQMSFKKKPHLKQHLKKHDPNKRVSCEMCGKEYPTIRLLRQHKMVHSDSYPFVCDVCNKCFRRKPALKQHKRQHTGEKPFSCETCKRQFTCWPNYKKHVTVVHGINISKKKKMESADGSTSKDYLTDERLLNWMETTLGGGRSTKTGGNQKLDSDDNTNTIVNESNLI